MHFYQILIRNRPFWGPGWQGLAGLGLILIDFPNILGYWLAGTAAAAAPAAAAAAAAAAVAAAAAAVAAAVAAAAGQDVLGLSRSSAQAWSEKALSIRASRSRRPPCKVL